MRRADRLFEIIQYLRTRRTVTTARRLAEEWEISERTVYRDIQDLMASGVPIEGEAGVGYVLRRGFDLPPLMFTRDEIAALVAGARWVQSWTDPQLGRAAARALSKIEVVAPPALRECMPTMPLFMPNSDNAAKVAHTLAPIRQAIDAQCKLALRYTREDGTTTERAQCCHSVAFSGAPRGRSPRGASCATISAAFASTASAKYACWLSASLPRAAAACPIIYATSVATTRARRDPLHVGAEQRDRTRVSR